MHTAGPLLVILCSLLLAAGFRLNEEPAVTTVTRAVRAQPLANATAAAHWALGGFWSESADRPASLNRCGRKGR